MTKYNVHFMGFYSYDVEVEAENEDEAKALAYNKFDNANPSDFTFENNDADVFSISDTE